MTTRDHVTGQYAYDGNFDRMCRCGHTLGVHVDGGWDCIYQVAGPVSLPDAPPCPCKKFRPATDKRGGGE